MAASANAPHLGFPPNKGEGSPSSEKRAVSLCCCLPWKSMERSLSCENGSPDSSVAGHAQTALEAAHAPLRSVPLTARTATLIPSGESPAGTGGSPVLPKTMFQLRFSVIPSRCCDTTVPTREVDHLAEARSKKGQHSPSAAKLWSHRTANVRHRVQIHLE